MKSKCDHTAHLVSESGQPIGSWEVQEFRGQKRIVCRHCGKFYGYATEEKRPQRGRAVGSSPGS